MATKKKAAATTAPTIDTTPQPSEDTRKPHEINSALASDRMQALLKDHQEMGARPK